MPSPSALATIGGAPISSRKPRTTSVHASGATSEGLVRTAAPDSIAPGMSIIGMPSG